MYIYIHTIKRITYGHGEVMERTIHDDQLTLHKTTGIMGDYRDIIGIYWELNGTEWYVYNSVYIYCIYNISLCMYIYIHAYIYKCMYIYIFIYIYISVCVYIYIATQQKLEPCFQGVCR
jgi:hypothetical protein